MKVAIVGSSGYIAGYLIDRFSKEPSIEQILKIDQNEDADEILNLTEAEKFKAHTGWEPEITFEKTMQDLLDYWRARVNKGEEFLTR